MIAGPASEAGNAPEPIRNPARPSEAVYVSVLWGNLQTAVAAHSRAVEAAMAHSEEHVPAWMVDDILTRGAVLDNAIYKALDWYSAEQIASIDGLHPRYVRDIESMEYGRGPI